MVKILKNEGSRGTKNIPDASIPPSTVFTGDIDTAGGVRVDGTVKGKVCAAGDVTIGLEGTVEGGIKASNVNIAGKIIGNVTSSGAVQMLKGSNLTGDLTASSFAIEEGAYYKGHCTITGSKEPPMLNAPVEAVKTEKSDSEAIEDKSDKKDSKVDELKEDKPDKISSEANNYEATEPETSQSEKTESAAAESENYASQTVESDTKQEVKTNTSKTPNNRKKYRNR